MKDRTVAIVLAAGQGKRMNSKVQKQYLLLQEKPVLYYTLEAFEESMIDDVVLVVGAGEEEYCKKEIVERFAFDKVRSIVAGGKERYHSVYAGIKEIERLGMDENGFVFIHDGARPFVNAKILQDAYACVKEEHACVVGVPVKDTIKIANENGYVDTTPSRNLLWSIQTPQVFTFSLIRNAYELLLLKEEELVSKKIQITDDAMVVETFTNVPIKLVMGSYENMKITTPEDLIIAEELLKKSVK